MRVEDLEENAYVLKTGIHALAIEGDHGVGCVTNNDGGGLIVIRRTFEADERKLWICLKLVQQVRFGDEVRADTRKMFLEEGGQESRGR